MKRKRMIIPSLILVTALCGCTTQSVEEAKGIYETYTYAEKYEYETDSDGKVETEAYSEEKPTFTDWETVTGITLPPYDYKEGTVKYHKMNEKWTYGVCEYSVTQAVITKDINYAYEIMNEESAKLVVDKLNKYNMYPDGYAPDKTHVLWIKLHVKSNLKEDSKVTISPFFVQRESGHIWEGCIYKQLIQDEIRLTNPEKNEVVYNVMLKANEERDYWIVCDISKYNTDTKYYMSETMAGIYDTNSQAKYNGSFVELEIEDKTNR